METVTVKWVKVRYGDRPIVHAVQGGTLAEQPVYIGRVRVDKSLLPGRVIGNEYCSYIPQDSTHGEYRDCNYDILVCPNTAEALDWVMTTGDKIPSNAVEGGYRKPGEPYYIGRIRTGERMDMVHGRVNPRAGVLTVVSGFDNSHPQITMHSEFEILVLKDNAEIIEEISQQTLCNVRYNTSHEAVKHTIVPNVALANVPVRNMSSSVQKVKATTSFLITETFSWSDDVPQSNSSPMTIFKCGVPYFSFKDNAIHVTPIAVLPEQILPSDQIVYAYYPKNVLPQVTSVMVAGSLSEDHERTISYNYQLTNSNWGKPILRYIPWDQDLSVDAPPHTELIAIIEGTKHILEVPFVATLRIAYENGLTADEEYYGTFKSTWISDIGIGYDTKEM